ncbi:hypothetical protein E2493_15195 [Sphingomonas parva]|uniref:Uncharacterized protein n=1 Tax=Sphingomonas parva TaxID=2555898 RepID=A0A4Y8ZN16_9SPHN|nr:hypothetical protein [Sphingomonas parva]TFI57423.1 hypothetical protein E2493_15195 [Sphingomonas parva]
MIVAAFWRTLPSLVLILLLACYAALAARSGGAAPPEGWLGNGGVSIGRMAVGAGLAGGSAFLVWLMAGDGARIVSMALPEILAWVSAFEITTLIDAIVGLGLLSAGARLRAVSSTARRAGAVCLRGCRTVMMLIRPAR